MNQIFIRTHKGEYVGGETIYGTVYLNLAIPLPAKSLELRVKGVERTKWNYVHYESVSDGQGGTTQRREIREHAGKKEFFKVKIVMYEYPTIFTPGYFAYPFQFTLPANLPGVFMKHKKSREDTRMKAEIFYKIKATLDIPGTKHDLKITQPLVIHERLDLAIAPQHYTKNGTVRLLCCIPRGDVNVEAWMDKNAYMAGETAQIHVRVQNGSKSNIDNFAVKLMRVITITNGHGASKVITDTVAQQQYPGCLAGESKESDIPLPLVSKKGARGAIKPATTAGLVKCVYHVDIEMQIPWAPDVEIHAPVKIYAPANFAWAQWQPPQWAAQATIQPVMGDLSVPQAVLQTQFTGLPAF